MAEVPKIVRDRLRSAGVSGSPTEMGPPSAPQQDVPGPVPPVSLSHPDANLLSAFAEQALSPSEREQILTHLSACEDCRAAVVLALPALKAVTVPQGVTEPETSATPSEPKKSWFSHPMFAWPTLRWGALAAGVVVAGALLLHYGGKSNPPAMQATPEARSSDIATPAPQTSLKSGTAGKEGFFAEQHTALANEERARTATPDALLPQNKPMAKSSVATTKDAEARSEFFAKKQLAVSQSPGTNLPMSGLAGARSAATPARETVQVSGATAAAVQTQDSKLSNQLTTSSVEKLPLQARNEMPLAASPQAAPPITRAKPATAAEQSAPTPMAQAGSQSAGFARRSDSPQAPQFTGIVTDPSGAAVAHAKVTVTNQGTGASISTTTDESGAYSVNQLPPGTYNLIAQATGFSSVADSNVALSRGINPHNFMLPVGRASEVVEVTGAAAALQSGTTKLNSSVAAPKWSLSSGMLRRSLDGGATWQTSLPSGHLLCYAPRANEIWAGGKSGLLFHSLDNGATWTQVHPVIGDRSLADDVAHLEFHDTTLVLTTSTGETWTTSDAGKIWTAK